jgi:hypothetical protein
MSLYIRQTPPPRLTVRAALMWIGLIALVMAIAYAFGDHTPQPL